MKKLLLVALVCAGAVPGALGQTGRIALAGHGGSVGAGGAMAGRIDNFGYPVKEVVQEVEYASDTTVLVRGYLTQGGEDDHHPISRTVLLANRMKHLPGSGSVIVEGELIDVVASLYELQKRYPEAAFRGFKKFERRKQVPKKPAGHLQAFPQRPFQYSYWRELTAVVALGTVGWLLGKKRPV